MVICDKQIILIEIYLLSNKIAFSMKDQARDRQKQHEKDQKVQAEIEIDLLEHLKKVMQPHKRLFNLIDFFELIVQYTMKLPNKPFQSQILQHLTPPSKQPPTQPQSTQPQAPKPSSLIDPLTKKINQTYLSAQIKNHKLKYAESLLQSIKPVFLYAKSQCISFEYINNFVLSYQNHLLKDQNSLENLSQYQHLPHRRVRLDQDVKLCIMPQGDSSKVKSLALCPQAQNNEDPYQKQLYVITNQYIRSIKIDSQKLAKQGNKSIKLNQLQTTKINIVKNWYTYSQTKVIPESYDSSEQDMKIVSKRQIYIEKVAISSHLVGILTHEKDLLVRPRVKEDEKYIRGRKTVQYQIKMGSLVNDIPDQNLDRPLSKDKAKRDQIERSPVLLFQCLEQSIWLIMNEHFIYVYLLPAPSSNTHFNDSHPRSSLLSLCQPLPAKATQAKLLTKQYLAIMLEESPCILIIKLQLSAEEGLREKNRIYPTNKIYNDIKFICMNYHPVERQLVLTDFGSYLIRLKFNVQTGDIQREGSVYDAEMGRFLTENTTNTRRDKQFTILKKQSEINVKQSMVHLTQTLQMQNTLSPLNLSPMKSPQQPQSSLTIFNNKGTSLSSLNAQTSPKKLKPQISPNKRKPHPNHPSPQTFMSVYTKPQNTDYMKIVKNSSRQNMILLCLNKNSSTLITYEETSEKSSNVKKQDDDLMMGDKDMLYNKVIKLWDINYLNVYQTFTLSLQIADLRLQSNGLYIVTKDRGYLGYYPLLNKQTENTKQQAQQQHKQKPANKQLSKQTHKNTPHLSSSLTICSNTLYFCVHQPHHHNLNKLHEPLYQQHLLNYNNPTTTVYSLCLSTNIITNVEEIPAQIAEFQVKEKLYVLADTSNDKRFNLHIYDQMGNKEAILKANKRSQRYNITENYTHIKKITHFQFNLALWNKHSIKLIGSNLQQSFTIRWTLPLLSLNPSSKLQPQFDLHSLKSSQNRTHHSIEQVTVADNSMSVMQKHQNELYTMLTLSILNLEAGRIKYRVNDIRTQFNVLSMVNNIIMSRQNHKKAPLFQQDSITSARHTYTSQQALLNNNLNHTIPSNQLQQHINIYDFNSPLQRKCIYTFKYSTVTEKPMTLKEINLYYPDYNVALSHSRFLSLTHLTLLTSSLHSLRQDSTLVVSLTFKLTHQLLLKKQHSQHIFHERHSYYTYVKEISSQVQQQLNYIVKTSDANVKKVSRKVEFEYMGQSEVHERIVGHWEIGLEQLNARSNVRNFSYLNDLHSMNDQFPPIIQTLTAKIIQFDQQSQSTNKLPILSSLLDKSQTILKLYEAEPVLRNKEGSVEKQSPNQKCQKQNITIECILHHSFNPITILSLTSDNFFIIYSQQISLPNTKTQSNKNIQVKLSKLYEVKLDQEDNQKPKLVFIDGARKCQNEANWNQIKKQMLDYVRSKMPKDTQKLLKLSQKPNLNHNQAEHTPITNIQHPLPTQPQTNTPLHQSLIPKLHPPSPTSLSYNNMFHQWHITKAIEHQLKEYEQNSNKNYKELEKDIKAIVDNPTLKEKRIAELLKWKTSVKEGIKKSLPRKASKGLNALQNHSQEITKSNDIDIQQDKIYPRPNNSKKTLRPLNKPLSSLQVQLQKISPSIPTKMPKIPSFDNKLITKTSISSSKLSQLKMSTDKKTSKVQNDLKGTRYLSNEHQKTKSSNNQTYLEQSPSQTYHLSSTLQRTITEPSSHNYNLTTDNYLHLIQQSPLPSLSKSLSKPLKTVSTLAPNPESSLSNLNSNKNTKDVSKVKVKRAKTQISQDEDGELSTISRTALTQLHRSTSTITTHILPQILKQRQELNSKMKQKKSFLKLINSHLIGLPQLKQTSDLDDEINLVKKRLKPNRKETIN